MNLQHLEITNILGIRKVNIRAKFASVLVAGSNGAGKSSIAEAVRFAILGQQMRGSGLKKDYSELLHNGAKAGSIAVTFDEGAFTLALPSGKGSSTMPVKEAMSVTLFPERFAAATPAERRAMLFKLMGVKATPAVVQEKLQARGVDPERAELVTPLLAAGFESAMNEAKAKARDAKAAWRAVTGETYGSEKAKGWRVDVPANPGAESIQAQAEELNKINAEADKISRELGAMQAQQSAAARRESEIASLRASAAKIPDLEQSLKAHQDDLAELEGKISEAEAKAAGRQVGEECACPECGAALVYSGGKLSAHAPQTAGIEEAVTELPILKKSRDTVQRSIAMVERDLGTAQAAEVVLKGMEKDSPDAPTAEQIQALSQQYEAIAPKRKEASDKLQAMRQAFEAAIAAESVTIKAAAHHEDVATWELIAEAMAPGGIQAELLADAIEPFNQKLRQFADMAGWWPPTIEPDMNIIGYQKQFYEFISESQKWRCDAIIAAAFASISGAGFIMLDRFDVLDNQGRTDALYWLSDLAGAGVGSLVFGTMKGVPEGLEALRIHGVWIENGVAVEGN